MFLRAKRKKIKMSKKDKMFYFINDAFLFLALIIVAYPLLYIISSSFSSADAVSSGKVVLFPVDFSLEGYTAVFRDASVITGYLNTIFYTVAGTAINIFMTVLAAYPLSRKKFPGKSIFMFLFTFTMIFGGGLIPSYILMSDLGLVNTRWAMLIPGAIGVYNVIICRTFFQGNVPAELFEAAQLDGANHFTFLLKIVLPLSKSILAVLTLYYSVGHWNSYFNAFIYLSDSSMFPLQLVLREILIENKIDTSTLVDPILLEKKDGLENLLKYSLIVVSSVPFMLAYPFVQKHFVKGALVGAVKG